MLNIAILNLNRVELSNLSQNLSPCSAKKEGTIVNMFLSSKCVGSFIINFQGREEDEEERVRSEEISSVIVKV